MRAIVAVLALVAAVLPQGCARMACDARENVCAMRCRADSTTIGDIQECRQRCEATNPCR